MPAEVVLDASVAIKCFIPEHDSARAIERVAEVGRALAPEFIRLEFASITAKRLRRGDITDAVARDSLRELREVVNDFHPDGPLVVRAYEFASLQGFSAYDGLYLALAELRGCSLITADLRLVARAEAAGFGHLVEGL